MKRLLSRVVIMICALSLIACSTMKSTSLQANASSSVALALNELAKNSDYIELTLTDNTVIGLTVTAVAEDYLEGYVKGKDGIERFERSQIKILN